MISKELKALILGWTAKPIVTLFTILFFNWLMPQYNLWQVIIMYSIIIVGYDYQRLFSRPVGTAKTLIIVWCFLFLVWYFGGYLAVLIGLFVLFILYRLLVDVRRDKNDKSIYMTGLRDIEKRLFGRTLDKEKNK